MTNLYSFRQTLLAYLWGLLNNISSITILGLISVPIPGLASIIMGFILSLSQLDVLPSDTIYEWFFTFDDDDDEALNPYFEQVGFDSTNSLKNMGTGFIILFLNIFILPLLWIVMHSK